MRKKGKNLKTNSRSCFGLFNPKTLLPKSKHSQSQIISTVLLILLAVVAAMIIFSFAIPFIMNKLSSGGCIDVVNTVNIIEGEYTCYIDEVDDKNVSVKVKIGAVSDLIEGFKISINSANDETVTIKNGTTATGVSAFNGTDYDLNLKISQDNGAIVYKIEHDVKPDSVEIYSILKGGHVCESTYGPVTIDDC